MHCRDGKHVQHEVKSGMNDPTAIRRDARQVQLIIIECGEWRIVSNAHLECLIRHFACLFEQVDEHNSPITIKLASEIARWRVSLRLRARE